VSETTREASLDVTSTFKTSPFTTPAGKAQNVRTRLVQAHFSVSQTSRDKDPVIAVSTSWAGPETNSRVVLDNEGNNSVQSLDRSLRF
jgi:hypothetical protein